VPKLHSVLTNAINIEY